MDEKLLYTWRLFARHWRPLLVLFVGASVFTQIPSLFSLNTPRDEFNLEYVFAAVGSFLIGILVTPLSIASAFVILDEGTRGTAVSLVAALSRAAPRMLQLVFWWFVVSALSTAGLILFIVPGIYAWIKWSFTAFVVMDSSRRGRGNPLSQSFELTRGYGWYIFGAILLFSIPIAAIGIGVSVATFIVPEWANYVWIPVGIVAAILYTPVYVFLFVCYRDSVLKLAQADDRHLLDPDRGDVDHSTPDASYGMIRFASW